MSKHTKGPWKVEETNDYKLYVVTEYYQDEPMQIHVGDCSLQGPNRSANANLIAAAPEMLEALERMNERFKPEQGDTDDHQLGVLVEALIARARGEA